MFVAVVASTCAPSLAHLPLWDRRVLEDDLLHVLVVLGLRRLHPGQSRGYPPKQLLHVVPSLGRGLDKHHI